MQPETPCCDVKNKKWFKQPLYLVLIFITLLLVSNIILVNFGINFLTPALNKFWFYIGQSWWAILLGIVIGGLIEVFVPEQLMAKLLGSSKKSIFLAVLLGFLASACSHGILAIAVSLFKKGASTSSTLAFLLAAPWANIAITILLFSLFGLNALFIVFGALIIALLSGLVFQVLESRGIIESNKISFNKNTKIEWKWKGYKESFNQFYKSSFSLLKMVVWWVLFGFLLAAFFGTYLPDSIFNNYFGPTILGLVASLVLASVMEVCSEGTAPMAFELYDKTKALGNSFVFLQAGVVTDFTEIGVITTNIGRRAAIAMIIVGVPLVLVGGFLLNNVI